MTRDEASSGRPSSADRSSTRSLRRDAERNRQRIIDAAREVFAAHGLGPGLNEIARHAGLGVGTVYRHFADKDDLIVAAIHEEVEGMAALAEECLRADTGWAGLTRFLNQGIARQVADRGLRDALLGSPYLQHQGEERHARLAPLVTALLQRAHREGALRPGVTMVDLIMIQLMVTELANSSEDVRPATYQRYLGLLLDSLTARPDLSQLGEGLTEHEAMLVMQRAAERSR